MGSNHPRFLDCVVALNIWSSSAQNIKQLDDAMATKAAETFLYMSDEPLTAFNRNSGLTLELKRRLLSRILLKMQGVEEAIIWFEDPKLVKRNLLHLMEARNRELASLTQEVCYSMNDFMIHMTFFKELRVSNILLLNEEFCIMSVALISLSSHAVFRNWASTRSFDKTILGGSFMLELGRDGMRMTRDPIGIVEGLIRHCGS
jgi:hypothetical protein